MQVFDRGTAIAWSEPREAMKDAEARIMKAIWHLSGTQVVAIGDQDDLPTKHGERWYEISRLELQNMIA